jgi:hypothetical protein
MHTTDRPGPLQGGSFSVPIIGEGLQAGTEIEYTLKITKDGATNVEAQKTDTATVSAAYLIDANTIEADLACSLPPGTYKAAVEITNVPALLDQCGNTLAAFPAGTPVVSQDVLTTFMLTDTGSQDVSVSAVVLQDTAGGLSCFSARLNKQNKLITNPGM